MADATSRFLPYSAEDFRSRALLRLKPDRGAAMGDFSFNPDLAERLLAMERRPAAVLIPVIHREPEATVLFTQRTTGLRAHAGQIAFPGGRIDADDASPEAAALREAQEEIGLTADYVETLCLAPDYLTGSGYMVAPVVAIVRPGFPQKLNPAEVAEVFEVPLSFLMNPVNHHHSSRVWDGATRFFFTMPYGERRIWGITAGIVRILYQRLYGDEPAGVLA